MTNKAPIGGPGIVLLIIISIQILFSLGFNIFVVLWISAFYGVYKRRQWGVLITLLMAIIDIIFSIIILITFPIFLISLVIDIIIIFAALKELDLLDPESHARDQGFITQNTSGKPTYRPQERYTESLLERMNMSESERTSLIQPRSQAPPRDPNSNYCGNCDTKTELSIIFCPNCGQQM